MILLVSNSRDFATDLVVDQLRARGARYLRLDMDLLAQDRVALDPIARTLTIERDGVTTQCDDGEVGSILFRAPTHLRESSGGRHAPEQLLARHQWAAFVRSLMVFERAHWVNHPTATYRAENKPWQLAQAATLGWEMPRTVIANAVPSEADPVWDADRSLAVKALDSFLLRLESHEDAFFYTQRVARAELAEGSLAGMPVIVQRYLRPKVDLRVTVVGPRCFAVAVVLDGAGIEGDWRLAKDAARFEVVELPARVRDRCVELVRTMGLVFGAIDLARVGDAYYFLEVNPTGEWTWLVSQARLPIHEVLADELCGDHDHRNEVSAGV